MNILAQWCNKIYPMFQTEADKIKAWKLPDNVDKLFDEVWGLIPAGTQTKIWAFIKDIYAKYGPAVAAAILAKILADIKTAIQNAIDTTT